MNYLIEDCIYPIIDEIDCVGQGFTADGYFITAAHIIHKYPKCFIEYKEERIVLSKLVPLYIGWGDIEKDPYKEDVVIYIFDSTQSILHLSDRILSTTDCLRSVCINANFSSSDGRYYKDLSIYKAVFTGEKKGNYFYCRCDRHERSSGSPLIIGNEVVGIMHGGDGNGLCAFLRPQVFMYPEVNYNNAVIRVLANRPEPEEPMTPAYFNRRAREQMEDAFDGGSY